MYISAAHLRNVKCFDGLELQFQSAAVTGDPQSNWNVILGENGDGKTSFLQALASCLMDVTTAHKMLEPQGWVRRGEKVASLGLTLMQEAGDTTIGRAVKKTFERKVDYRILNSGEHDSGPYLPTPIIVEAKDEYRRLFGDEYERIKSDIDFVNKNVFSRNRSRTGWFSAGYGPFRRVSGASEAASRVVDPFEKRFLTLYQEGAALIDCELWLKELQRLALKSRQKSRQRSSLEECKALIRALLPEVSEIRIEKDVEFSWRGHRTDLSGLSDGYRSMFVLIVDILRWLEETRSNPKEKLSQCRGVVLIDEIDTHLHPKWQREAGFLLCKHLPNIQFIVTSHSPFVAMAAGKDALTLLEREGDVVRANQDLPYVRGWAVDQVLSQLFGLVSLRDPETEKKLERYEELRTRRRRNELGKHDLSELERLEQELSARMSGASDSLENREMDEDLAILHQQSQSVASK